MNDKRKPYFEETMRTIPLMRGRTIENVFTSNGMFNGEVTGLRIRFTDGTEVTLNAEVVSNGMSDRSEGPSEALDVARARGLYSPRNPRQATNAAGEVVELS